ncbi:peptidase G2 autoproteolytic cleavage domain-containing protein [Phaeobacter sp. PT47_59]|uniref:peptidase G2 autoproteolytic cleavage domain-containing protein n=1 Tax=Phaeobacter sp. PT47_59 TaxID=3029979 RepID=UPI0023806EED|nr:peptidase G2 autoproteolytic cleavage domain-containing protein [Phaeobacter sp. PT47_59]MDE4175259.1 peptidase G2 autoproteolytic cleavage domain-containing protein [Phaeobacter sp. PT47_59]
MSETSPILSLPYLMPSQAQKHVTHNEALQILDAVVQLRVTAFDAETPPADPTPGAAWALGGTPTGSWAGQAGRLAIWQGEGWLFLEPLPGWRAWGLTEEESRIWDGSAWILPPHLGVNTSADASNRLAVASPATLLTHEGAGHQLKINKASSGDTGALLFQSNWRGRAEMGLLGKNDFTIKVSSDGGSWAEALRIDRQTGHLSLGASSPAYRLDVDGDTRIDGALGVGITPNAYCINAVGTLQCVEGDNQPVLRLANTNPGFSKDLNFWFPSRSASSDWNFLIARSGGGSGDAEFKLTGNGNGSCDGAWSGGGADYAEWFEWADGSPTGEDRRGIAVVLVSSKIRPAGTGDDPIGVISTTPALVGDGDLDRWKGKYMRDDFNAYLWEDHEVDGNLQQRRQLNPAYDPDLPYTPRAQRGEWAIVGLMGKLRLRRGQPTATRWIKMRKVSSEVEEWLLL